MQHPYVMTYLTEDCKICALNQDANIVDCPLRPHTISMFAPFRSPIREVMAGIYTQCSVARNKYSSRKFPRGTV